MPMIDPDQIPPEAWKKLNITKERFVELSAELDAREKLAPRSDRWLQTSS